MSNRPNKTHFWLYVIIIFLLGVMVFILLNKDNTETSDKVDSDTAAVAVP